MLTRNDAYHRARLASDKVLNDAYRAADQLSAEAITDAHAKLHQARFSAEAKALRNAVYSAEADARAAAYRMAEIKPESVTDFPRNTQSGQFRSSADGRALDI